MGSRTSLSTPWGYFERTLDDADAVPVQRTRSWSGSTSELTLAAVFLTAWVAPRMFGDAGHQKLYEMMIAEFVTIIATPIVTEMVLDAPGLWKRRPLRMLLWFAWFAFGFFVTGFVCDTVAGTTYMRYDGLWMMAVRLGPLIVRPPPAPAPLPELVEPGRDADGSYYWINGEPANAQEMARIKKGLAAFTVCAFSLLFYLLGAVSLGAWQGAAAFGTCYYVFLGVVKRQVQYAD